MSQIPKTDPTEITFFKTDAQGNKVKYDVRAFGTTDAQGFAIKFYAYLIEPLTAVFSTLDGTDLQASVKSAFENKDMLPELGKHVSEVLLKAPPSMFRDLFRNTMRNGEYLDDDVAYDEAYKQNWMEWLDAIKEIIMHNGFIPFLGTSSNSTETDEKPTQVETKMETKKP